MERLSFPPADNFQRNHFQSYIRMSGHARREKKGIEKVTRRCCSYVPAELIVLAFSLFSSGRFSNHRPGDGVKVRPSLHSATRPTHMIGIPLAMGQPDLSQILHQHTRTHPHPSQSIFQRGAFRDGGKKLDPVTLRLMNLRRLFLRRFDRPTERRVLYAQDFRYAFWRNKKISGCRKERWT